MKRDLSNNKYNLSYASKLQSFTAQGATLEPPRADIMGSKLQLSNGGAIGLKE